MIKDTLQKQKAIRYCVALGYVPCLEVVVRYLADTSEIPSDISDIDVLGLRPSAEGTTRAVIFDCKTQAKISGISRALWAAGLRQMVHADEAFVILNRAAPPGHRLAATDVNVRLFSEKMFDDFAKASSINYLEGITYLDESMVWVSLLELRATSKRIEPLVNYLTCEGPLERDPAAGFRSLLSKLKYAEGEFDVAKPLHRLLYGMVVSQALLFLSAMTKAFNSVFDPAMTKPQFENALRNYVWGGKEGYLLRQRLHQALNVGRPAEPAPFQLPGWEKFVELQRLLLDAPLLAGSAALPIKDLAFSQMCPPKPLANKRIAVELLANQRARQFALLANRYIGSLSRLLKECSDHYTTLLSELEIT